MTISIKARQASAHRMISRWGGAGFLIRGSARRTATMARLEYTPKERGLFLDGSSRFYVSIVNLQIAPDHELDILEFQKLQYKILLPASGPRPTGPFVYYDLNCMFSKAVT